MDYPPRKSKPGKRLPATDVDSFALLLAEYSPPFGEETPWRELAENLPEPADALWYWKPERGRLH